MKKIQKYKGQRKDNGDFVVGHPLVFGDHIKIYDPDSLFVNDQGIETLYGHEVTLDSIEEFLE